LLNFANHQLLCPYPPGLIVLGVLVFFVSLIGCLGALKSNRGLLKLVRAGPDARG